MKSKIELYSSWVDRQKGRKSQIEKDISETMVSIERNEVSLKQHEQAREIIREVGLRTQQQLQFHIGDIASLALDSIFQDAYKLTAEFVERRNKTECDLYFERDGDRVDPLSAAGGGAVDVAAFALRVASWSMARPRTRSVLILDEPLRFLSADHQEQASTMIKEISQKLGIQFIIVTHQPILASYADKVFEVSIRKGVSKVI